MASVHFLEATTAQERESIDTFLDTHNQRGKGSTKGYIAYYAAISTGKMVAAAKFCPLHTPQAAKFFAGEDWRHAYCLQRLAAHGYPGSLSEFMGWCLRQIGKDSKVWYVATYADTGTFNPNGIPHNGGIYRACNAVECGISRGGGIEGYELNGERFSMRKGPKTLVKADIPVGAYILRSHPKHRYCWAVGSYLKRRSRLKALELRMSKYKFQPIVQPRLLMKVRRTWQNVMATTNVGTRSPRMRIRQCCLFQR